MRKAHFVFALFLFGCGAGIPSSPDAAPTSCDVPPTWVTAYQDCGGVTKDGYRCFTTCGELPPGGGVGALLPPGCLVGQAETPVPALCVASCAECE